MGSKYAIQPHFPFACANAWSGWDFPGNLLTKAFIFKNIIYRNALIQDATFPYNPKHWVCILTNITVVLQFCHNLWSHHEKWLFRSFSCCYIIFFPRAVICLLLSHLLESYHVFWELPRLFFTVTTSIQNLFCLLLLHHLAVTTSSRHFSFLISWNITEFYSHIRLVRHSLLSNLLVWTV